MHGGLRGLEYLCDQALKKLLDLLLKIVTPTLSVIQILKKKQTNKQ